MGLYVILRGSGWRPGAELGRTARSTKVGEKPASDDVRWLRSYVFDQGAGSVGQICIYQATSPEAIRKQASLADLPIDELIPIAETVPLRSDSEPAAA